MLSSSNWIHFETENIDFDHFFEHDMIIVSPYRAMPPVLEDPSTDSLIRLLIVFVCNNKYVTNPYLVAKLVEVMFYFNPSVQPRMEGLHEKLLVHELSREHLAPALMQFYTGTTVNCGTETLMQN